MSTSATPEPAKRATRLSPNVFSLDTWAVFAAVAFIVLILAGVLPRVPW